MKRIQVPQKLSCSFLSSLPASAHASVITNQWLESNSNVLLLLDSSIAEAEIIGEDISALVEFSYPEQKFEFHVLHENSGQLHPDSFERNCEKICLLSTLIEISKKSDNKIIIATTPSGILSPCPLRQKKEEKQINIRKGMELDFLKFQEDLQTKLDYSSEILCEDPGQYALRGGLIDIYPVNGNQPVRIDFFGNEIEEIRTFDPTSQRTTGQIQQVILSSAKIEEKHEKEGEFFSYLSDVAFWVFREPENLISQFPLAFHESIDPKHHKACMNLAWKGKNRKLDFFLGLSEINAGSGILAHAIATEIKTSTSTLAWGNRIDDYQSGEIGNYRINYLFELLGKQKKGYEVIIATGAESEKKRILEVLSETSSLAQLSPRFINVGLRDGFTVEPGTAGEFFRILLKDKTKGLTLATAREILGRERSRRPMRSAKARVQRKSVDQALDFSELISGDHLVHHQHGICLFQSLGRIELEGRNEEAITIEFADGLLLHVPLQESHLLSRYVGLQRAKPKLAKLGGKLWAKTRQAAESAALDLAADLLRIQATRESKDGFSFAADDQWQKEFEDAFPYTETPDQQKAIDAVKQDMEEEEPMDRLICGDVGFGKTEVALRAAFKAVMDGKQVAVLAPTTILSQQHFNHFSDRMSDYPVTIEMLSRFRTRSQQKKILQGAKSGAIDLIIGTHRMLGSDVKFNDLGLLVVDEEQRFGVQHKEAIKRIRENVDVLTLSATPIPRTLYFAMVGARDLSSIETAPVTRRPIRTEVMRHSPEVVERAVQTEIKRGGQVFYLHNRVKTIDSVARKLQAQFPNVKIAVGHGQMSEDELEMVMTEFVAGEYDMLVCTTIIESGLDIPNCNTIIIEGADKFGLSQLYQLRGRVGRFDRQAYAYLLLNRHLTVSEQARKRLSAIKQVNHFGAGLQIALRDLELRGAGNLLGSEQSGHVAGIGFELYCRLLRESVSRLKGDEISLRPSATVRLDFLSAGPLEIRDEIITLLPSYLPEEYAQEPRLRIECYRRLAKFRVLEEIDDFMEELIDRFGMIPDEGIALLEESRIRCLAEEAGFDQIESKENELYCRFSLRSKEGSKRYYRLAGKIPKISSKTPLLKLKEIIRFLKIVIHGNKIE